MHNEITPEIASLIKEVTMFRTTDGKDFNNRSSAESHQQQIAIADDANERLARGESIAEILRANGMQVPDEILEQVTKDSKLVISHWQCRDTPGYQPRHFYPGLEIYVAGDAGGWSGPYGNKMSLRGLASYAKHEASMLKATPPHTDIP